VEAAPGRLANEKRRRCVPIETHDKSTGQRPVSFRTVTVPVSLFSVGCSKQAERLDVTKGDWLLSEKSLKSKRKKTRERKRRTARWFGQESRVNTRNYVLVETLYTVTLRHAHLYSATASCLIFRRLRKIVKSDC
jgi:hypothetical protein